MLVKLMPLIWGGWHGPCATQDSYLRFSQKIHTFLRQNMAMNSRRAIGAVAISALALFPAPAFGEPTPSPSPGVTRSPIEQYRIDRENYLRDVRERNSAIKIINMTFKESCDKAVRDFRIAMSVARTPDQKNFASNVRKNAISAAVLTRDASIAALGPEPVPPVEPSKSQKISTKKRAR